MERDPRFKVDHRSVGVAAVAGLFVLGACGPDERRIGRPPDSVSIPQPSPGPSLPDLPVFSDLDVNRYVGDGRKFLGLGVVFKSWGDGKPDARGYNPGCSISVKVIAGRMRPGRNTKWAGPGRTLDACSCGGDIGVLGQPVRGSLVGYYERGCCMVFEVIEDDKSK